MKKYFKQENKIYCNILPLIFQRLIGVQIIISPNCKQFTMNKILNHNETSKINLLKRIEKNIFAIL